MPAPKTAELPGLAATIISRPVTSFEHAENGNAVGRMVKP